MSDHKFAIGTEWRTRGGWKATVLVDDGGEIPIWVAHDGNRGRWHLPDGLPLGGASNYDLIAPWSEPTPSAKDEAFAAMLEALKRAAEFLDAEVFDELAADTTLLAARDAIQQAEQCQ